jgi:hypothetical protein
MENDGKSTQQNFISRNDESYNETLSFHNWYLAWNHL